MRKQLLFATAIIAFIALISAMLFEPLHAGHDCHEEDCPVCAVLQAVRTELRSFYSVLAEENTGFVLFYNYVLCLATGLFFALETLIAKKVKLSE